MAEQRFIKSASDPTVYDLAGGFLDPVSGADDFRRRAGTDDIAGNTLTVDSPNSYLESEFRKQAENRYLPQRDLALQGLDQAGLQLGQQEADVNRQYDTLGQQLRDAAEQATGTFQEQQNRFGLLSSGATAAGLGRIGSDLSKNTANAAQERASQLAQLALQRAGLATRAADVKLQAQQGIQDLVSQLLSGSTQKQQQAFQQELQLKQVADTIPVGQTATIQGRVIQGTMQPQYQQVDLGDRIAFVDPGGNVVRSIAKGASPSSGGIGSSKANASDLMDAVRQAVSSGEYTASGESGKKSREQLISDLVPYVAGTTLTPVDVANAVYSAFRGPGEGAFTGLSESSIQQVNSLSGKSSEQKPLSSEAAKTVSNSQAGLQALSAIEDMIRANPSIPRLAAIPLNPGGGAYRAAVANVTDILGRLRSGGAISESEEKRFAQILKPSVLDTPETVAFKINQVRDQLNNMIQLQGGQAQSRPPLSSFLK